MSRSDELYNFEDAKAAILVVGFTSQNDYKKNYRKDPRLPSNPDQTYSEKWKDWRDFLGKEPLIFYDTLLEAADAAANMGISTAVEYEKRYKEDPLLPSKPSQFYSSEWISWNVFLSKKYSTIKQVKTSLKRLNIHSLLEYSERRKEDPRLPVNIPKSFGAGALIDLFGTNKYKTYEEASKAALSLGITSYDKYQLKWKLDPGLPQSPANLYKSNWVNWWSFFGKTYPNVDLAKEAVEKLGIKTPQQYDELRHLDPALPKSLHLEYNLPSFRAVMNFNYFTVDQVKQYCFQNKITTVKEYHKHAKNHPELRQINSLPGYAGKKSILYEKKAFDDISEEYFRWKNFAYAWIGKQRNISKKEATIRNFLSGYVSKKNDVKQPEIFLAENYVANDFTQFFESLPEPQRKADNLTIIIDFVQYILEETCVDIDDSGDEFILSGFRNPLKKFAKNYESKRAIPNETVKPALPFKIVVKARDWLIPPQSKSFNELKNAIKLLDSDFYDVPEELIDRNDPDCVWRTVVKYTKQSSKKKFEVFQMWSPVRTVALYTLFQTPARGQQILWLDSGECDHWKVNCDIATGAVEWTKNDNKLANPKTNQGFLRRFVQASNEVVGMFFTTNKTGQGAEGSYEVPWIPANLIPWITKLRDWQSKYNPVDRPVAWTEIHLTQKVNVAILKKRPPQTFLFRDPSGKRSIDRQTPITPSIAFKHSFPAVLYHIQSEKMPLAYRKDETNFASYYSEFTPHCMRVSLITCYIIDGGVELPIISKLVGHSRVVMTIYYTKISQSIMRRALAEAEVKMLADNGDRFYDDIIEDKLLNDVRAKDPLLFQRIKNLNKATLMLFDYGICTGSSAQCHIGGEKLENNKGFAPVPAGYLGSRNCPHCRFFLTGPAFVGGLTALSNDISFACSVEAKEIQKFEMKIQHLEQEQYYCEQKNIPFNKSAELRKCENELEKHAGEFDQFSMDLLLVLKHLSDSVKLINTEGSGEDGKLSLIGSSSEILTLAIEETSEFHQLHAICKNAEFYVSTNTSIATLRRSHLLDMFLDENGMEPIMFKLTEQQQLKIGNQLSNLVLTRLNGHNVESAMVHHFKLADFLPPSALKKMEIDIKKITKTAASQSIPSLLVD